MWVDQEVDVSRKSVHWICECMCLVWGYAHHRDLVIVRWHTVYLKRASNVGPPSVEVVETVEIWRFEYPAVYFVWEG
jgi:hypothetical protein